MWDNPSQGHLFHLYTVIVGLPLRRNCGLTCVYLPGLVSFSRAASVWDTNRGRPWTCLAVFISCEPRMDKQLSRPHPSYCLYAYSIRYRCIRVYNWQYMPWQWVVWLCSLIRVCLKHSASPEWMDRIVLLRLQGHQLGMAIFLDTYIDEHAVVLAGFLATLSGYPFCKMFLECFVVSTTSYPGF